jgi:TolB-like protein
MKYMKIKIAAVLLVFMNIMAIYSQDNTGNEKELIRRSIAILPFLNQNGITEYDYLSDIMRDTLKSRLVKSDDFIIVSFFKIDDEIKKRKITLKEAVAENNAKNIAIQSEADILITGKYMIIKESILVQIEAIDIFSDLIIDSSSKEGNIGLDVFRIIDDVTNDIYEKLKKKLKKVDKTYFDEMMRVLREQEKEKNKLSPMKKVGIGLISGGSTLLLSGIIIFIVDNTYILNKKNFIYEYSYPEYLKYHDIDLAMFSTGLILMICGGILDIISIPLLIYIKGKITFKINIDDNINIYITYIF